MNLPESTGKRKLDRDLRFFRGSGNFGKVFTGRMENEPKHLYVFGPFGLDTGERVLRRDSQPIALTPKAVETLLVLLQNAGRLVEKDEVMKKVWPDAFVEEGNLAKNIFI